MNGRLKGIMILGLIIAAGYVGTHTNNDPPPIPAPAPAETYSLVHAIGNDETIVANGLSKRECEAKKRDHIAISEALGIHSEKLGIGSITCLPDSIFAN